MCWESSVTSTETGRRAQDGHLDFYTAPKLCNVGSCWGIALTVRIKIGRVVYLSSDKNQNEHKNFYNNTWRQTTLAVKPKDTETHPRGVGCLHRPHFMFNFSIICIEDFELFLLHVLFFAFSKMRTERCIIKWIEDIRTILCSLDCCVDSCVIIWPVVIMRRAFDEEAAGLGGDGVMQLGFF